MWMYCLLIALISTSQLPHPASESPCSASENNRSLGILWGAWPWPAQPTGFHPWLFKGQGRFSNSSQGQGIWAATTSCKLPSDPYLMSYMSDHCQLDWATAVVQSQHTPLALSWRGDLPTHRSHSHSRVSVFLGSHPLMPICQQQENGSLTHQAPPHGSPMLFPVAKKNCVSPTLWISFYFCSECLQHTC